MIDANKRDYGPFKKGDRVVDGYLGKGTVLKKLGNVGYLVRFDRQPPRQYNNGTNPTLGLDGVVYRAADAATAATRLDGASDDTTI